MPWVKQENGKLIWEDNIKIAKMPKIADEALEEAIKSFHKERNDLKSRKCLICSGPVWDGESAVRLGKRYCSILCRRKAARHKNNENIKQKYGVSQSTFYQLKKKLK